MTRLRYLNAGGISVLNRGGQMTANSVIKHRVTLLRHLVNTSNPHSSSLWKKNYTSVALMIPPASSFSVQALRSDFRMQIRPRKLFLLQRHSLHRLYFTSQPKSTTYQVPERQCLPSNFKLELPALLASSIHEPLHLSTVQRYLSSPPLIPMPRALNLRTISSPSLLQF